MKKLNNKSTQFNENNLLHFNFYVLSSGQTGGDEGHSPPY